MTVPADRRLIGGADIGAILGISPHASAADVWLRIVHGEALEENEVMKHGLLMEPGLFQLIRAKAPGNYREKMIVRHPTFKGGVGHLDLLRVEPNIAVVDAKMVHWRARDRWIVGNETVVPDFVRLQCDWYVQCADAGSAQVGVFFGLGDFEMLNVPLLDADTRGQILEIVERFWVDHIETGIPPPPDGSEAYAKILTRLYPQNEKKVELDDTALAHARRITQLKKQLKELEAQEKAEKEALETWLKSQNATSARHGSMSVSWSKTVRNDTDWKGLVSQLNPAPELLSRFAKTIEYTSLRITEKKS